MEQPTMTKKYFQTIIEHHDDLIFTTDISGRITMINSACSKVVGKSEEEAAGISSLSFFSAEQREKVLACMKSIAEGKVKKVKMESEIQTASGETKLYSLQMIEISGPLREILFIGRNITKLRMFEDQIKRYSLYDEKTGLPNRINMENELSERIIEAKKYNESLSVLFIQIKNIKMINDALGHQAGDRAIAQMAERIKAILPERSFIGRFSTNKFTVLIHGPKNQSEIETLCNAILAAIQNPIYFEKQEFYIGAAIGISQHPVDGKDPNCLLKNAGIALRYAKAGTHDSIVFHAEKMNMEMVKRADLESSLRKGVEHNNFFLVYQPIIQSATREIIACEALLRWSHPKWGIIPPMEFIPIAEETGMIHSLGKWILKTACMQVKEWQAAGYGGMSVSVNVSAYQLDSSQFVRNVKEALVLSGLGANYLHLELTESVMVDQSSKTVEMMRELKKMGVKISIDDFGTGYSALSYLKHLPIHSLKIDRSFISNLDHQSPNLAIVGAILTMGRGLGLQVVAEGIETSDQLSMLTRLGCDFVQGYLIEKPLEASSFTGWLEKKYKSSHV